MISMEIPLLKVKNEEFYDILDSMIIIKNKRVSKGWRSCVCFQINPHPSGYFITLMPKCKNSLTNSVGGFYYKEVLVYMNKDNLIGESDVFQETIYHILVENVDIEYRCEVFYISDIIVEKTPQGSFFIENKEIFPIYVKKNFHNSN
jgi:hypothetical protein